MDGWRSEDDLVRTDVVAVDELARYLASSNGREQYEYLPYRWEQRRPTIAPEKVGQVQQMTHYLVLSWKGRP